MTNDVYGTADKTTMELEEELRKLCKLPVSAARMKRERGLLQKIRRRKARGSTHVPGWLPHKARVMKNKSSHYNLSDSPSVVLLAVRSSGVLPAPARLSSPISTSASITSRRQQEPPLFSFNQADIDEMDETPVSTRPIHRRCVRYLEEEEAEEPEEEVEEEAEEPEEEVEEVPLQRKRTLKKGVSHSMITRTGLLSPDRPIPDCNLSNSEPVLCDNPCRSQYAVMICIGKQYIFRFCKIQHFKSNLALSKIRELLSTCWQVLGPTFSVHNKVKCHNCECPCPIGIWVKLANVGEYRDRRLNFCDLACLLEGLALYGPSAWKKMVNPKLDHSGQKKKRRSK